MSMPPITGSHAKLIAQPTVDLHTTRKPKIAGNSKPELLDFPEELMNKILNSVHPSASAAFSMASRKSHDLCEKIYQNMKKDPDLDKKYEGKYPYLHLIAKPSLQEAIDDYNQQINKYRFLNHFEFEDDLSNKDLWGKINKVVEEFDWKKVDKKIEFYTFCLSFNKLAENAARALGNLANNSDNQQAIVEAGAIAPLVKLVRSGTDDQKVNAAEALGALANDNRDNQNKIAKAGAIEPLVELVRSEIDAQKRKRSTTAERALENLAYNNPDNQKVIMEKLVKLLTDGTDIQKDNADTALLFLGEENPDNQKAIVEAGASKPYVELVKNGTDAQKEMAANSLMHLAANNLANQNAIVEAGAIKPLIELLENGTDNQKDFAAGALGNLSVGNLAANNLANQNAIAKAGAIEPLIKVLRDGRDFLNPTIALRALAANNPDNRKAIMGKLVTSLMDETNNQKENVAMALGDLAEHNPDNQNAIFEAGAIDPLVVISKNGTPYQKENAARALGALASNNPDIKRAIREAGAIEPLMDLFLFGTVQQKEYVYKAIKNL